MTTAPIDLAALRTTAKERSDLIFAGFGRGEEEIDQSDVRARDLAYGVLALLDRLEAAEAVCEEAAKVQFVFGDGPIESIIHRNDLGGLKKALDAWRQIAESRGE